jgi:hypothetical protein
MEPFIFLLLSVARVFLTFLSFFGFGAVIRQAIPRLPSGDTLFETSVTIILGALIVSQVLIVTLLLGFFSTEIVFVLKGAGIALALAFAGYWSFWGTAAPKPRRCVATAGVIILLFLLLTFSLDTPIPHPDARQYHVALPWVFATEQALIDEPSLMQLGLYMGYDLLYLTVGDLRALRDSPSLMSALFLFNAASLVLLLSATYALARSFGATPPWSAIAGLSVLTLGAVFAYWGDLKNDYAAAGVALSALVLLHRAWNAASGAGLVLASIVAAFAVAIKISALIPVGLPFAFAYVSGRFSVRIILASIGSGLVVGAPWLFYAALLQGAPLYPLGAAMPAVVAEGWDQRNANGLPGGAVSAITNAVDVLLGRHFISGNQSLGLAFLAATVLTIAGLLAASFRRRFGPAEAIAASAIIWLVVFYVDRFDGRFLSRYIVICGSVFFAFAAMWLSHMSKVFARWGGTAPAVLLAVVTSLILFDLSKSKWITDAPGNGPIGRGLGDWYAAWVGEFETWTGFHRLVNAIAAGSGVAVNDHFILFLDGPYLNLHGLHARALNLYEQDASDIHELLTENGIETLLYRPNISGATEALTRLVETCADAVALPEGIEDGRLVYRIRPTCGPTE